jgi:DNA-binding transcriptional MerR regulator
MLGNVERSNGGTRTYTQEQVDIARAIDTMQFARLSIDEIRDFLNGWNAEKRKAVENMLINILLEADERLEKLPVLKDAEYDL